MCTIYCTCSDECFLFHVITGRHYFLYKFIVNQKCATTVLLLRSLKKMFWKKSTFYIRRLHNNITTLLIPKVQNKTSTSYMFFINIFVDSVVYSFSLRTFHIWKRFTFHKGSFSNLKAEKAPYRHIFLLKAILKCLWRNIFLEINENKNRVFDTYINNDYAMQML